MSIPAPVAERRSVLIAAGLFTAGAPAGAYRLVQVATIFMQLFTSSIV